MRTQSKWSVSPRPCHVMTSRLLSQSVPAGSPNHARLAARQGQANQMCRIPTLPRRPGGVDMQAVRAPWKQMIRGTLLIEPVAAAREQTLARPPVASLTTSTISMAALVARIIACGQMSAPHVHNAAQADATDVLTLRAHRSMADFAASAGFRMSWELQSLRHLHLQEVHHCVDEAWKGQHGAHWAHIRVFLVYFSSTHSFQRGMYKFLHVCFSRWPS